MVILLACIYGMSVHPSDIILYLRMYLHFNCDPRFYIGHTPVLVVGNPEMVKEITIKQAANFMDRSVGTAYVHEVL